jgi:hypothetical protein
MIKSSLFGTGMIDESIIQIKKDGCNRRPFNHKMKVKSSESSMPRESRELIEFSELFSKNSAKAIGRCVNLRHSVCRLRNCLQEPPKLGYLHRNHLPDNHGFF